MKKTPESKANRHHTLSRVFEIILFVSLAAASVYSAIRLAGAPESLPGGPALEAACAGRVVRSVLYVPVLRYFSGRGL